MGYTHFDKVSANSFSIGQSGEEALVPYVLNARITSLATASTEYIVSPVAGTIYKVYTVLDGVIGSADNTITVKDAAGSSAGTITVAYSGSAAGDIDSVSPTTNNVVTAGGKFSITNTVSSGTVPLGVTILIQPS